MWTSNKNDGIVRETSVFLQTDQKIGWKSCLKYLKDIKCCQKEKEKRKACNQPVFTVTSLEEYLKTNIR